jgi:Fic family protein
MKRGLTGVYRAGSAAGGEVVRSFIPKPLPPSPDIVASAALRDSLDQALLALGRLDSISTLLPDADLFLYTYVRKEAVLSSQIEGTQSSLSDLLLFEIEEAPGAPLDDVTEVSNYVGALNHGLGRIRNDFPLSNRLIREVHEKLLSKGRGADKQPGEFRTSQNWIGGTRPGNATFVPPPHDVVGECMGALEKFLHNDPVRTSTLTKAALAHVQFETVHPFLDGNGRVGRLLIPLLFCAEGILRQPLLYLSLYFKQHRQRYYDLLMQVRTEGDWEAWLEFFADAVRETATGAVDTARSLVELFNRDRERISGFGRAAGSALLVHHELQRRPLVTVNRLVKRTKLSAPTVGKALDMLMKQRVVREITGRQRNRAFTYGEYMDVLNKGTEPL